jgi:hypothetical protein
MNNVILAVSSSDSPHVLTMAIVLFVLCAFSVTLWIMPGIIAAIRKHHNTGAIWIVTLLLGWTFIGWVVALVWSFTNPAPAPTQTA